MTSFIGAAAPKEAFRYTARMAALKCPSPSCTFLFDPTRVPAGAVLTCPRCALRFTLAPPPDVPPADPDADSLGPPQPAPPPKKRGSPLASVAAVGGVLIVLAVVIGVVAALLSKRQPDAGTVNTSELVVGDKNFAYAIPAGWNRDPATQNAIGANVVALQRSAGPPAWAALAVTDFDTREPTPADLRGEIGRQLGRLFVGVPAELPLEPATWAGKPARHALFRGEHRTTAVACVGEVYALSYKGIAYWFTGWAAEADAKAVAAELDAARDGFRLLDGRHGWAPRPTPEVVFRSVQNNSKFRLATTEAIWTPAAVDSPTLEDPKAELLLKGVVRGPAARDRPPTAQVVVLVLPAAGDPAAQADKYVRGRHTRDPELFGPIEIKPVAGDIQGDPLPDAPDAALAVRLAVRHTKEGVSAAADKLIVYAAVPVGTDLVVAEASCPLDERAVWERRLVRFVGSLRPN